MVSFSKLTLLDAYKRVKKSQEILAFLDGFRELHLYLLLLMSVFFSGFMKSRVVYAGSLYTFVRFETMI